MRMNKKLKNVLAFGLATSFVLTSTMGALATDDGSDYSTVTYGTATDGLTRILTIKFTDPDTGADIDGLDPITATHSFNATDEDYTFDISEISIPEAVTENYDIVSSSLTLYNADYPSYGNIYLKEKSVAPTPSETVTKTLIINFTDPDTGANIDGLDPITATHSFNATDEDYTFDISEISIPEAVTENYDIVDSSLTLYNADYPSYGNIYLKEKSVAPTPSETVSKTLTVIFTDPETGKEIEGLESVELNHEFTADEDTEYTFPITEVTVPEGYELSGTQLPLTVYKDAEENVKNVYVVKKTVAPVSKTLTVIFTDPETGKEIEGLESVELNHEFTADEDTEYTFPITEVTVPEGYELSGTQLPLTVYKDAEENVKNVYVVKKTVAPVSKTLTVIFTDPETGKEIEGLESVELNHEFTADEDTEYTFPITEVTVPEGYELSGTQLPLTVYKDAEENVKNVYVVKKTVAPVSKTLTVIFTDPETGKEIEGLEPVELNHEFTADEDTEYTFPITEVTVPEGYELSGTQLPLTVYKDTEENVKNVYVVKKVEEVKKIVKVVFSVNSAMGEFTGYDGATTIHYTIAEDSAEQYLVPEVKAADGYKFVGWQVEGKESGHWDAEAKTFGVTGLANYPEGSNEGYLSIDAIFEEVKEPAPETRTANVYFTVDPEKGSFPAYAPSTVVSFENLDEFSDQQLEIPAVEAKEGYKFVGWKGQGADVIEWDADATTFGVTGLAFFAEGSNVGYASVDAVFEKEEEPAPETRTVNVYFAVDPEKGSFPAYAPSTVVSFENLDEFSDQQLEIPAVEAKEGYKFVGWKGQGADVIEWDADAKTFGVTGLAFFEEGSNVGNASVEAVFEPVTEPDTTEPDTTAPTEPDTTVEPTTEPDTTVEPTTEPDTTVEPTTEPDTIVEPTTDSEEETTEEATTEDETETEKKATVTEKNNKSDDNSNKTSDSAVKTGDTTTVMPYVIALFAAAALIVVLALKKKNILIK